MRIGAFEIRRHDDEVRAAAALAAEPKAELGASGTINVGGFLQSLEYNRELRFPLDIDIYERMRSSDGSVQEALGHICAPIRNADWDIEATDDDDPLALEIAEAVRRAFFKWPEQPFEEYLDNALDFLVFGHQVFEHPWQIVEDSIAVEDQQSGDVTDTPTRQFVTFRRFAPRAQRTIWQWNENELGDLESITQQVYKSVPSGSTMRGGFEQIEIPASSLVVFTNQRRGSDYRGRSLLRAAYKHWKLKELIEKIEAVALERHGVGTWIAYLPEDSKNDTAMVERVEEILQNMRAGAYSYIVAPFSKQLTAQAGATGGLFEVISPGSALPDFKTAKEYHRGEIKGSVLVRFSELGHSSVGARSTGDTQSKIWYDALHAVARHFSAVNDVPIKRFVDANYPGQTAYPKMIARNIEARSLSEFAQANAQLVAAGAIEPDQPYRAAVRVQMGLPEEAPDTQQTLDENAAMPPPAPFGQPPAPPEGTPPGDGQKPVEGE
jgi:hypothetical protein